MIEKLLILLYFIKFRWFSRFYRLEKLQQYQHKWLEAQKKFINENSFFYKDKADLPVMDKKAFMEHFNDINTVGIDKKQAMDFAIKCEQARKFSTKLNDVTVGLSSGTSGHRGVFLVGNRERVLWAGAMLAKVLPKRHLLGVRIAFFMRADSELYETVKSQLILFKFFDMWGDMDENLRELQAFRPTILVAPPSCLLKIATWNSQRQIKPRKVISIAEVLEHKDAEILKKAFDADVIHQIYQCTEGFLGVTCEYGTLHMNEDIIKIEKEQIDEQRFIPIITDMRRRAQPVIRYRLNDVLVEKKEPCKCGSVFLALDRIEGRQDDVFEFEGEHGTVSIFPDFIRRSVLLADDIGEYRVQQISSSMVVVFADNLHEKSKQQIIEEFSRLSVNHQFNNPNIIFKPYEYDNRRKLKRVEKLC